MADEDAPDEGGLEPAADEDEGLVADAPEEAEAPAEESYTRSELAALLPHFDRFQSHEGADAFKEYGSAYENARRLISTGGHMTPQEEQAYRSVGIDPSEVQIPQPEPDEAPGLWGTPWQEPTTWDEVQSYANSEDPQARRLAAMAVLKEPSAPEEIKQAYFSHWAAIDPAGAAIYQQQAMQAAFEERLAEHERRIEERYGKTHEDLVTRNVTSLMETAKTQIPGFQEHAAGIEALFNANAENYPGFQERFFNATLSDQLVELRRLTIIAAAEAAPERAAGKQRAEQATDAAKLASRSETSRTNGAPETEQQAAKRRSVEDARRVGGRVY